MTKYFEKTTTRIGENLGSAEAWAKGEENLGLKNSLFICEDGVLTQYADETEGEKFYQFVSALTEEEFNEICENFFKAIEEKNLEEMHKALAIFDEMDNYNLGTETMKRRLMRIRKATHEESYKLKDNDIQNFIIFKGVVFTPKKK